MPGALDRRRVAAFVLVVAAHLLLVLLVLRLSPPSGTPGPKVASFELLPDRADEREEAAEPEPAEPEIVAEAPRLDPPPPTVEAPYKLDIVTLSKDEFAAADIARLPRQRSEAAEGSPGPTAEAAQTGPNGERLYNAEWYRRPTQAELSFYLPRGAPRGGWALIACQTVADYRVDNCIELDQAPAGSGLSAAMRQAAWQFRVLPPRIGGRPMVGAWVRILIEFSEAPR
jgi:protein TonB